jgi:hypothetical protein
MRKVLLLGVCLKTQITPLMIVAQRLGSPTRRCTTLEGEGRKTLKPSWRQLTPPGCVSFYVCKYRKGKLPARAQGKRGYLILDLYHRHWPDSLASFGDVDLSVVKNLETVRQLGPSTIGIDTIYRSQGNIPEAFLRGAGVPDSFLEYMRSLVSKPIDYYSCFISYSSEDQAFAERLDADLQSKGVRCWYAPHDMKIGVEIRPRIDESIRVHDKLLLVVSESSLASTWVKKEVETAFEKETQKH